MITRLTDGAFTFREPKVLGQQVLKGMFRPQGKGNFKAKALIEGSHRLIHYEGANLPAQTGALSRVDEPEQMYGLDKYAERVLKVWERVPQDQRDLLWYGGAMTFTAYRRWWRICTRSFTTARSMTLGLGAERVDDAGVVA
jgi:hypothetical protein